MQVLHVWRRPAAICAQLFDFNVEAAAALYFDNEGDMAKVGVWPVCLPVMPLQALAARRARFEAQDAVQLLALLLGANANFTARPSAVAHLATCLL